MPADRSEAPGERFRLTGQVALVTGGTRGLGRAMARGLAQAGARVVLTGRRQEACEAAARELARETGAELLGLACHMGDWAQIDALVERSLAQLGRVDALVNNAAINPAAVPLAEVTSEFWDKLYAVNVKGPLRLAARLAPRMGEAGGGSIINVISQGAHSGGAGLGVYTSAKAALLHLTRVMAQEWAPLGVRVNALTPGPFLTDLLRGSERAQPGYSAQVAATTLLRRVADPDEIVGAVLFLASRASSFVTAEELRVTGGMGRTGQAP
jgi:gluconate 5-dehydrogenase